MISKKKRIEIYGTLEHPLQYGENLLHLVSVILIETGLAEISQQAHHCHNLVHPGLSKTLKPFTLCFTWPHTNTSLGAAAGGFRT